MSEGLLFTFTLLNAAAELRNQITLGAILVFVTMRYFGFRVAKSSLRRFEPKVESHQNLRTSNNIQIKMIGGSKKSKIDQKTIK